MTYHDNLRFAKICSERMQSAVTQIAGKSMSSLLLQKRAKKPSATKNSVSDQDPKKKKGSKGNHIHDMASNKRGNDLPTDIVETECESIVKKVEESVGVKARKRKKLNA
mmetsp:Transcript_6208/g.9267  ORF Transcript_6208/g.9267 Transcript_6208/m.9267 type:complete len:109 (+) Transcript_6208:1078-1404(+)